jgi:dCMP deaminase
MNELEKENAKLLKWDNYFYNVASKVGENSSCLSRQIGSVLVKDKTIIGSGYNGPPRGVPHCNERYLIDKELREYLKSKNINPDNEEIWNTCPRYIMGYKSGQGLQWCIAGHAERNALINSARMGIKTKKCKLYMDCGIPCTPCLVEIINAGIEEIIVTKLTFYDTASKYLIENTNSVRVRVYSHLCDHKNVDTLDESSIYYVGTCRDCGLHIRDAD